MNRIQTELEQLQKLLAENNYIHNDIEWIMEAATWGAELHGEQKRASGEPYYIHPIQVASVLIEINLDPPTIVAALLHDTIEDTGISRDELEKKFGSEVAQLVDGVTKISILKAKNKSVQEIETIRKMLIAMVKDIRVILIKLADKLHNMRTLSYLKPERQKAIAAECLEIYAPLAGQLGMSSIKAELEDLSLKYLNPDVHTQIKQFLALKKKKRAEYLKFIEEKITAAANKESIDIKVTTRAKHFYSIYKKMTKSGKDLNEIYDLLGIRIFCRTVNECYAMLGIVHNVWIPIERRFKDYIAVPKSNKYQSLHTTVMTDNGKILEVQIRTHNMHKTAEYGIAAHWLYKKGQTPDSLNPKDIALVNKLKKWNTLSNSNANFLSDLKKEILKDTIYVFTPAGDVFEMPAGSTAIDFAYHIHSEVGNHCVSAKADGYIIPLGKELQNTQVVEIITNNSAHPHLNWLRMAKTTRAKSKIRQWLNKHDDSVIISKNIVAKNKLVQQQQQQLAEQKQAEAEAAAASLDHDDKVITEIIDTKKIGFKVNGEKNLMISFGKCCSPKPGDSIIGYISVGRGIIVHRKSCPNLKHIKNFTERSIDVEWEALSPKATRRFKVTAKRTHDLFAEIEGAVRKYRGHLIEGKLIEIENNKLSGYFTLEIENKDDFKKVAKSIRTIPSILTINSV